VARKVLARALDATELAETDATELLERIAVDHRELWDLMDSFKPVESGSSLLTAPTLMRGRQCNQFTECFSERPFARAQSLISMVGRD